MELITYRKFSNESEAEYLTDVLSENGVAFEVTSDRQNLDALYGGHELLSSVYVKIRPDDFEKVDAMLRNLGERQLASVSQDHYLFSFSNQELYDILQKPDEWSDMDYVLARRLLEQRGEDGWPPTSSRPAWRRLTAAICQC